MNIAVAIQTCDRYEYTRQTVESFIKQNALRNYRLYYGDDASTDNRIHDLMRQYRIPCIYRNRTRQGNARTRDKLLHAVAKQSESHDYILPLENDIETVRKIPIKLIDKIFENKQIGIFRLFGKYKAPAWGCSSRCAITGKIVKWAPIDILGEELACSTIHWTYMPTILPVKLALQLIKGAKREGDSMKAMKKLPFMPRTIRPRGGLENNFIVHIGNDRTKDYRR